MQILDQAVAVMRKGGADGAQVAARLEAIAAIGDKAARIWQDYIDKPGADGDKYSLISWMGPDRARALFDLSLEARALVKAVCAAAGPEARFLVMDESPIMLAYAGLKDGQTGPQAAAEWLAAQQAMTQHVRALADQVRTLKPGKAVAKAAGKMAVKKAAAKKPAAKKPASKKAPKKAASKATKKPARKK